MKTSVQQLPSLLRSGFVLVDFMSTTCQYCRPVPGVLKELQKRYPVKVYIVDINDDIKTVTNSYRVQALPTVVLFKNGREVTRTQGALSLKDSLTKFGPHLR